MPYTYQIVETALARVFGANEEAQRGIFRARLKHLQRSGLPSEAPGKGQRISYTDEQVCDWLVALQVAELGIDPVLVVALINGEVGPRQEVKVRRRKLTSIIQKAWKNAGKDSGKSTSRDDDTILVLIPKLMSSRWTGSDTPAIFYAEELQVLKATRNLDDFLAQGLCVSAFNLSARPRALGKELNQLTKEKQDKA